MCILLQRCEFLYENQSFGYSDEGNVNIGEYLLKCLLLTSKINFIMLINLLLKSDWRINSRYMFNLDWTICQGYNICVVYRLVTINTRVLYIIGWHLTLKAMRISCGLPFTCVTCCLELIIIQMFVYMFLTLHFIDC